ncbi:heparan sulfate glucosamine 3-O-sulfotransferase 1-like isoform X2 [Diadema antillarum]
MDTRMCRSFVPLLVHQRRPGYTIPSVDEGCMPRESGLNFLSERRGPRFRLPRWSRPRTRTAMNIRCCGKMTKMKAGWTPVLAAIILIAMWLVLTRVAWIHFGESEKAKDMESRYDVDRLQDSMTEWKRKHKAPITPSEAWDMYKVGCYTYKANGEVDILSNHKTLRMLECKRRLPGALIVGVRGCDTFILTKILGLHPSVVSHSGSHFEWPSDDLERVTSKWKREQPYSTRFQITIEHSPAYADDNDILEGAIRRVIPGAKLIIMLRDPVQRAIMEFARHHKEVHNITLRSPPLPAVFHDPNGTSTTHDSLVSYNHHGDSHTAENTLIDRYNRVVAGSQLIRAGVYVDTLRRLRSFTINESILVVDKYDFVHYPLQTMQSLEAFLGLKRFFREDHFEFHDEAGRYCVNVERRPDTHCVHEITQRPLPSVDEEVLLRLKHYYADYDLELVNLLQRNFSWMQ